MNREPILNQYKRVWLDKEAHKKLRYLKLKDKKSMAQIVKNLISAEHSKVLIKIADEKPIKNHRLDTETLQNLQEINHITMRPFYKNK